MKKSDYIKTKKNREGKMDDKGYNSKKAEIKNDYNKKIHLLMVEYCRSNNDIEVGDIIEGNGAIIKVENMKVVSSFANYPSFCFSGPKLTKKLIPFKNGDRDFVHRVDSVLNR